MTIKMANKSGVLLCMLYHHCHHGGCQSDMEQLVTRWWQPVASGIAMDILHQAMHFISHRRTAMAIEMAGRQGDLFSIVDFIIDHNHN
jgi:hypothetical protein